MGCGGRVRSPAGRSMPRSFEATMSGAIIHIAVPRSETSTTGASPVRSRWKSAAATPPVRALAVAAHVDGPRVHAPDVLDVDLEALARGGEEVRQEHVRRLDQAVE